MTAEFKTPILSFEELLAKYGNLDIKGTSVSVKKVMDEFVGLNINAIDIDKKLQQIIGPGDYLSDALDVLGNARFLYKIEWDSGYTIVEPFTDLPVLFEGPNGGNKMVSSGEAQKFEESNNLEWKRIPIT